MTCDFRVSGCFFTPAASARARCTFCRSVLHFVDAKGLALRTYLQGTGHRCRSSHMPLGGLLERAGSARGVPDRDAGRHGAFAGPRDLARRGLLASEASGAALGGVAWRLASALGCKVPSDPELEPSRGEAPRESRLTGKRPPPPEA